MDVSEALRRTRELVSSSEPSLWVPEHLSTILRQLDAAIAALEAGAAVDRSSLSLLFAPTGALQDLSIDNGWGEDFVALSRWVDAFLDGTKGAGEGR